MSRNGLLILTVVVVAGCASAVKPETSASTATAVPAAPVLRLLAMTPPDGAPIDSSGELVATLAYHIPDYDPARQYTVSAVFVIAGGRTYNRGASDSPIKSPTGIITLRQSLDRLWGSGPNELLRPLTGSFFLLEHDSTTVVRDTVALGDRARILSSTRRSAVRARSRTFHFNGAGPARSLASSLPDVLEEYWTYKSHKAVAVAYDDAVRWTHGYAYGHRTPDAAVQRALRECQAAASQRGVRAPCRLVVIDERGVEPQP